jgi:uncharacterized membrane protein YeaQ/YmgE (transglycosylase-associated protein family)
MNFDHFAWSREELDIGFSLDQAEVGNLPDTFCIYIRRILVMSMEVALVVCIVAGGLLGVASNRVQKIEAPMEMIFDVMIGVICGVIGYVIYDVLFEPNTMLNPLWSVAFTVVVEAVLASLWAWKRPRYRTTS